jgi:hypothetical protein
LHKVISTRLSVIFCKTGSRSPRGVQKYKKYISAQVLGVKQNSCRSSRNSADAKIRIDQEMKKIITKICDEE